MRKIIDRIVTLFTIFHSTLSLLNLALLESISHRFVYPCCNERVCFFNIWARKSDYCTRGRWSLWNEKPANRLLIGRITLVSFSNTRCWGQLKKNFQFSEYSSKQFRCLRLTIQIFFPFFFFPSLSLAFTFWI